MKTFYRFLTSLFVSSLFRSVVASNMKKRSLTPLAILIMMLTGCAKIADTLRPDSTAIIPIGAGVLATDNVRFVGSESDISGHRFDTAASAYASEVVRDFFKEQQAFIDMHCPLKADEPLPTTDFFRVYFPSRTERDQFVDNLPGKREIWYVDVVSIVINEEVVNYSAEISLIITEACQAETSLISTLFRMFFHDLPRVYFTKG